MKVTDSWFWNSVNCLGTPPKKSSIWVIMMAPPPLSSVEASSPVYNRSHDYCLQELETSSFKVCRTFKSTTEPGVNVVQSRRGGDGVEQYIWVSSVEVSKEFSGDRYQSHFLHPPHLQARLLACKFKLLIECHGDESLRGKYRYMSGHGEHND